MYAPLLLFIMPGALFYWKAAGVILTSVVGMIGLLGDFRTPTGQLTKWGRRNVALLVIGAAAGIGAEAKDAADKLRDAAETNSKLEGANTQISNANSQLAAANQKLGDIAKDNQDLLANNQIVLNNTSTALQREADLLQSSTKTLGQVNRSLNLIRDITLSWEFEFPLDVPALAFMNQNIDKEVKKIIAATEQNNRTPCGQYFRRDKSGDPVTILFYPTCSAVPQYRSPDDEAIRHVLNRSGVCLSFISRDHRSQPGDPDFSACAHLDPPDPLFTNRKEGDDPQIHHLRKFQIEYDLVAKELLIVSEDTPAKVDPRNSGRIISLPDLEGAGVQVALTYFYDVRDKSLYDKFYAQLRPRRIFLKTANQTIVLPGSMFSPSSDSRPGHFEGTMPKPLDTLRPNWQSTKYRP